ncbi:MAG: FxSxx-COOH system tetratricopeptide repeat protein [Thermomicrobiales bacterium]
MAPDARRYLILAPVVACSSLALLTYCPVIGGMGAAAWIAKQSGVLVPNLLSDLIPIGWTSACVRLFGTSSEPTQSLFDEMKTTYLRAIDELPGKVSPNQPKPQKALLGVPVGRDSVANRSTQDELAFYEALKASANSAFEAASRSQNVSTLLTELERGPAVAIEAVNSLIDHAAAPYPGLHAQFVPLVKKRFPSQLHDTFRSRMHAEGAEGTRIWRTFVEAVFANFNDELRQSRELNQEQLASLSQIENQIHELHISEATQVAEAIDDIQRLYERLGEELGQQLAAQTVRLKAHIDESETRVLDGVKRASKRTEDLVVRELAKYASPPPAPKRHIQNLTHSPSRFFVGRQRDLKRLHQYFQKGNGSSVLIQSIQGLGGVGKTQLAVHFSHSYASDYDGIWWFRAESDITLAADYADLGRTLELNISSTDTQEDRISAIRRRVEHLTTSGERWLLIFDNALPDTRERALWPFIPRVGHCDVLITSRVKDWTHIAEPFDVGGLDPEAAVQFLQERTQLTNAASAKALAAELGYLPLALEQAGAFIAAQMGQETFSSYLDRFRSGPLNRLGDAPKIGNYQDVVATTWLISFDAVQELDPATTGLLEIISFFAPENIPINLIVRNADLLAEPLSTAINDSNRKTDIVGHLLRYSLVEASATTDINIHRLVQTVIREWLPTPEVADLTLRVAAILARELDLLAEANQRVPSLDTLAPHIRNLAIIGKHFSVSSNRLWRVVSDTAILLGERARYREAISLIELTNDASSDLDQGNRSDLSTGLHHLARFNRDAGELGTALDLANQALEITVSESHESSVSLAMDLQLRGNILRELGRYKEAESDLNRALELHSQMNTEQSDAEGSVLNDLGVLYRTTGRLDESMGVLHRALAIHQDIHPENHREIANDLANIADTALSRGELGEAEHFLTESLEMLMQFVDNDHPRIAHSYNMLGRIQLAQGEIGLAESSFETAIELGNRHLEEYHPILTSARGGLVRVLHKRGDFERAALLADSILSTRGRRLSGRDTQRPALLSSLSVIFGDQGDLPRARRLAETALEEFGKIHQSPHPLYATLLGNLGAVQFSQGDLASAESTLERAYSLAHSLNGLAMLDGATILNNFGAVKDALGKTDEALPALELALSIQRERLKEGHPDFVPTLANLGLTRCRQKQWKSGIQLLEEALAVARQSGLQSDRVIEKAKRSLAEVLEAFSDELYECRGVSEAMTAARRSLRLYRELKDPAGERRNLHRLRLLQEQIRRA